VRVRVCWVGMRWGGGAQLADDGVV
jgi:hypothetical protein